MSFKTINLEEYKRLLKNRKKMFDITFPTPESLNKYRDDNKINEKNYKMKKLKNKIKTYLKCLIKTWIDILMKKLIIRKIENTINQAIIYQLI